MRKLRKLAVFAVCISVFLLLSGCFDFLGQGTNDFTDEIFYDYAAGQITIAINGHELPPAIKAKARAASASSRALTHNRAFSLSEDYEVVFMSGAGLTAKIARATWISGQPAQIPNVDTNGTIGVDYAGAGKAIIFAGRGNTLLGVGILKAVIQEGGTTRDITTGTSSGSDIIGQIQIDHKTVAVTFEVAALTGGASFEPADSSLRLFDDIVTVATDPLITDAHTAINRAKPGDGTEWPIYLIPNGVSYFEYRLDTTSDPSETITPPARAIDKYLPGIYVRNESGTTADKIKPRLATLVPSYAKSSGIGEFPQEKAWGLSGDVCNKIEVATGPIVNETPFDTSNDDPFEGKIVIKINAPVGVTAIGAFNFELPVYALTDTDGKAKIWYIKNGYGTDNRRLDDGKNGTGGAFLIGIGNVQDLGINLGWIPGPVAIGSISITSGDITTPITSGSPQTMTATITPNNGTIATVVWNSNKTYAVVTPGSSIPNPSGQITATVARVSGGGLSSGDNVATITVTVTDKEGNTLTSAPISVTIDP